ncbi:piggyBac transposable element-derived protein 3-like [Lucilia cuprina]|uniref:piggyBac transposable element-derived protein 3-like n=1 Tax=Lucilia cuprina TaxID=7375 RepID=UPI001F05E0FD|nr:piggyBac transposable element-derived protein 3-like [Lucilia cuprina]
MSTRTKVLSMKELDEIIANWSDDDCDINCVNILPPDRVDECSDEETINDDEIALNVDPNPMNEVAGYVEIETERNEIEDSGYPEFEEGTQPSTSKKPRFEYKPLSSFGKPKRTKRNQKEFHFDIAPNPETLTGLKENICSKLSNHSPLQLFQLFYDNEVFDLIIKETNIYAGQNNTDFQLDEVMLKRFIGILLLSGYHTLPSVPDYWSSKPSLGIPMVKQTMSRSTFLHIKSFIHFANNNNLDNSDKMAKLRPLFDILNRKFLQFGVWDEKLSIDEQMVPYFGRHSCKMFIRGKPIRFGYKFWCLCSSSGYLYSFIPYCGSADQYNNVVGLGADVVMRLLSNVEYPMRHEMAGQQRGHNGNKFRSNLALAQCTTLEKKSTSKKNPEAGKYVIYGQPTMLHNYNKGMGGVDLHDNAIQNYRVNIRGKKWYWPLWCTTLNSAVVNAWKLHCLIAKHKNEKPMSQKEFKIFVTEALLLTEMKETTDDDDIDDKEYRPHNLPKIEGKHVIIRNPEGKHRRCQLKGCGKPTIYMCEKCNVHLHTKCFKLKHE